MRLAGLRWETTVSEARLGPTTHRVIQPARAFTHATLHLHDRYAGISADKTDAAALAAAWWLAARSPRSIVHLPLRSGSACDAHDDARPHDLVLLHRTLGFRTADWKAVRGALTRPRPHTIEVGPEPFPELPDVEHHRIHHREFNDHLRWRTAADTLFVIGTRTAFDRQGHLFRALVEEAPADRSRYPATHWCIEVDLGRKGTDRRNPSMYLHVECCDRHW